jgi:hypothetical protein
VNAEKVEDVRRDEKQRLLDDVGWVDARRDPRVEPAGDHAAQARAMDGEELPARRSVTPRSANDQVSGAGCPRPRDS